MSRQKTDIKIKEPVKIRFKELKGGRKSIYLDIYEGKGKRKYEFLNMFLEVGNSSAIKIHNDNVLKFATAIKNERVKRIYEGKSGITSIDGKNALLFTVISEYKQRQRELKRTNENTTVMLENSLRLFCGDKAKMKEVTKDFCIKFIEFLKSAPLKMKKGTLSNNSQHLIFSKLNAVLNYAVQNEIITSNPIKLINSREKIKVEENTRCYLTKEEVEKIINLKCRNKRLKNAFLFSCFSGLRISDIRAITWGQITNNDGRISLHIIMKKTKEPLYLPLSKQALNYLPERKNKSDDDKVFDIPLSNKFERFFKKLEEETGIKKHITFHVARHTFATLALSAGVDIYTTSKLLGHANIQTTQIYAKIINEKKEEAVNLLSSMFD